MGAVERLLDVDQIAGLACGVIDRLNVTAACTTAQFADDRAATICSETASEDDSCVSMSDEQRRSGARQRLRNVVWISGSGIDE